MVGRIVVGEPGPEDRVRGPTATCPGRRSPPSRRSRRSCGRAPCGGEGTTETLARRGAPQRRRRFSTRRRWSSGAPRRRGRGPRPGATLQPAGCSASRAASSATTPRPRTSCRRLTCGVHQAGCVRGDSRLGTRLTRIAINEAVGRLRRPASAEPAEPRVRRRGAGDRLPRAAARRSRGRGGRAHVRRLLEQRVHALPAPLRLVVILRDVEGLSTEATAAALGIRPYTVKNRLNRGRGRWRRAGRAPLTSSRTSSLSKARAAPEWPTGWRRVSWAAALNRRPLAHAQFPQRP